MELVSAFITLVIPILILALVVWLLGLLPTPEPYSRVIRIVAIVLVVLYLLSELFGVNVL